MMGSINLMLKRGNAYEDLIDAKLESLDLWIQRIEKSNKPLYIPPFLYDKIKGYVKDALLFDFNMIIEEFNFYQKLSSKMQSQIIDLVFVDFQKRFRHFFDLCEKGFLNELIINMYARNYPSG